MVIDNVLYPFLGGKFQPVRLHQPFVAALLVATEQGIVVVNVVARLGGLRQFTSPMQPVECSHFVLFALAVFLLDVEHQLFAECRLIL